MKEDKHKGYIYDFIDMKLQRKINLVYQNKQISGYLKFMVKVENGLGRITRDRMIELLYI